MKKILRTIFLLCCLTTGTNLRAQPCTPYEGLKVVVLHYGTFAQQSTSVPILTSEENSEGNTYLTNHIITWNETTGNLESLCESGFSGGPLGSEYYSAYCACIVPGPVLRSVNYACADDNNTCGVISNTLPVTDTNSTSTNWSSPATWVNNTYNDLSTAPAIFVTKPINFNVDISLDNYRWIVISNSGAATIAAGTTFINNSVVQVRANGFLQNNGTLKGIGQIQGALTNNGILATGNSPGVFSITGNYTATPNAVHQIEIASLTSYDQVKIGGDYTTVGGNAVLKGTLNVNLLNGYIPSLEDSFKIFSFTSSTGAFAHINLPALSNGLCWNIHYNLTDITLEVVNTCSPAISILDKTVNEGNSGTTAMKFRVTLSAASSSPVKVNYATADSTASAPGDYTATSGTLKFNAGQTSKTITVLVNGDTQKEKNEKLKLILSQPVNANLLDSIGIGTIKNDDAALLNAYLLESDNSNVNTSSFNIALSPNPAKSNAVLHISGKQQNVSVTITDIYGKMLWQLQHVTNETINLPIENFAGGMYIISVSNGKEIKTLKLVKE